MNDSDIISQSKIGNKGAYREILRKYSNLVLAITFAHLGDTKAARKAAVDCFIKASKELRNLSEKDQIAPWLTEIARKAVKGKKEACLPEAIFNKVAEIIKNGKNLEDLETTTRNNLAMNALESLPETGREVLCLVNIYSNSYADIASAMQIDIKEVAVKIAEARGKLTNILEPLFKQR